MIRFQSDYWEEETVLFFEISKAPDCSNSEHTIHDKNNENNMNNNNSKYVRACKSLLRLMDLQPKFVLNTHFNFKFNSNRLKFEFKI